MRGVEGTETTMLDPAVGTEIRRGIVCGWCGSATMRDPCEHCEHVDPARPWIQRGQQPPSESVLRRQRLARAEAELRGTGIEPTVERIAERLDVSPRTVRRWREMTA